MKKSNVVTNQFDSGGCVIEPDGIFDSTIEEVRHLSFPDKFCRINSFCCRNNEGHVVFHDVVTAETAHIKQLVHNQKSSKKKPLKVTLG